MADLFDNPMGLDGFEFIEFSAPEPGLLEPIFEAIGFMKIAKHRSKEVFLWRQGGINFITNYEKQSPAGYFCREHGPSACGMAFRVKDAKAAFERAVALGAEVAETHVAPMELAIPAIRAIGGGSIFFVDRYGDDLSIYDIDFIYFDGVDRKPAGHGFNVVDHLTHNVYRGRMDYWAEYYERLFNFREIRFFDIKGEYTGLKSRALTAPDGKIRIPLNEEGEEGKGQIEEYLLEHRGEGIQHIALSCDDLYRCVDRLRASNVELMTAPPNTYYDMLDERLPGHGETVSELKTRGILLDGSTDDNDSRLLLQIFGIPQIGPVFFEFIQRKGDDGFGEGNFKALFESIERDQISRGVLDTKESS
ncbi:MAG: 4-hydroxyphenylpyruvate dioxygenase [Pseudomonadota bacterium]